MRIDGDGRSGGRGHLQAMFLAPKDVGDIPVVGPSLAGNAGATLDVLGIRLLSNAVTTDVGANRCARNGATGRGNVLAAAAPNLVTENAANDRADNCPGYIGVALILNDLFALNPTALIGRCDYGANRSDARVIKTFVVAPPKVVDGNRRGHVTIVFETRILADCSHR